jgi:hypothetical protein
MRAYTDITHEWHLTAGDDRSDWLNIPYDLKNIKTESNLCDLIDLFYKSIGVQFSANDQAYEKLDQQQRNQLWYFFSTMRCNQNSILHILGKPAQMDTEVFNRIAKVIMEEIVGWELPFDTQNVLAGEIALESVFKYFPHLKNVADMNTNVCAVWQSRGYCKKLTESLDCLISDLKVSKEDLVELLESLTEVSPGETDVGFMYLSICWLTATIEKLKLEITLRAFE